jgi:hypothetical protein
MSTKTKAEESVAKEAATESRKTYERPRLRRLGSVREITFGSGGMGTDAGTMAMMM